MAGSEFTGKVIDGIRLRVVPADRETAGYARRSLDKEGTGAGVGSQMEQQDEKVTQWPIPPISRRYVDNDISAHDPDAYRPDYERLRADIVAMYVGRVVIRDASRLHRRVDTGLTFMKLCIEYQVVVWSVHRGAPYDFTSAQGRADFIADTNAAQHDSGQRGQNVAVARKRQAKTGAWGGGVRAYGWGVDTGLVQAVCVNPKASPLERVYESTVRSST
ncbi:recombinase family protein [Herbidospora sp. RD11066]